MPGPISKIKDMFSKAKSDFKFKNAGEGHRLCDDSDKMYHTPKVTCDEPVHRPISQSAVRAGEAALQRLQVQQQKPNKIKYNTNKDSLSHDIVAERENLRKAYEFKDKALTKEIEVEKPDQLTRVLYFCPEILDASEIGTFAEIESKIHEHLELAKSEIPVPATALLLHCLNRKSLNTLNSSVEIIKTLLTNIISNPEEIKYRKIRLGNERIKKNIVDVPGAVNFLKAVGFKPVTLPTVADPTKLDDYLMLNGETNLLSADLENIQQSLHTLSEARTIKPILYRSSMVIHKSKLAFVAEQDLPQEFFRLSLEEIKRQQELKKQQVEESQILLTKEMRENLAKLDKRKYKYSLIRVIFPNNWVLQGTFEVNELLSDVATWIYDCLKVDHPFSLSIPPVIRKVTDYSQSLSDVKLVPCSSIRFQFDNSDLNQCPNKDTNIYLRDELIIHPGNV